jgi:hypothetical protein
MSKKKNDANPLYKTTVIVWTVEDPVELEFDVPALADEIEAGNAYCSGLEVEFVEDANEDPDWDGEDFFDAPVEGEEEEEEIDIIALYEQASGNKVVDEIVIVDSAGKYLGLVDEDKIEAYLGLDKE